MLLLTLTAQDSSQGMVLTTVGVSSHSIYLLKTVPTGILGSLSSGAGAHQIDDLD